MAVLSRPQVRAIAQEFFGDLGRPVVDLMTEIANRESSFDTEAKNLEGRDRSYSLWQVNIHPAANPDLARFDLTNPRENARAARIIWDRQGPTAWTTFADAASTTGFQGGAMPASRENRVPGGQPPPEPDDPDGDLLDKIEDQYPGADLISVLDDGRAVIAIRDPLDPTRTKQLVVRPFGEGLIDDDLYEKLSGGGDLFNTSAGIVRVGQDGNASLIFDARGAPAQKNLVSEVDAAGNLTFFDPTTGQTVRTVEGFGQPAFPEQDPAEQVVTDERTGEKFAVNSRTGEKRSLGTFGFAQVDPERTFGQRQREAEDINRRAGLESQTRGFESVNRLAPELGTLALQNAQFTADTLRNPSDFLARAFFQRGQDSPLPQVSQADIINQLRSNIEGFNGALGGFNAGGMPGSQGGQTGVQPSAPVGFASAPGAISDPRLRGGGELPGGVSNLFDGTNHNQVRAAQTLSHNLAGGFDVGFTGSTPSAQEQAYQQLVGQGTYSAFTDPQTGVRHYKPSAEVQGGQGFQTVTPQQLGGQNPGQVTLPPAPAPLSLADANRNVASGQMDFGEAVKGFTGPTVQPAPRSTFTEPRPGNAAVDELRERMRSGGVKGFAQGGMSESPVAMVGEDGPEIVIDMPGVGFMVLSEEQMGPEMMRQMKGKVPGAQGGGLFGDRKPGFDPFDPNMERFPRSIDDTGGGVSRRGPDPLFPNMAPDTRMGAIPRVGLDPLTGRAPDRTMTTGFTAPQLPTFGAVTQPELQALERQNRPPAVNDLMGGRQPASLRFGFALPTPQLLASLTPAEREAWTTTLAVQHNTTPEDVEFQIARQFGGTGGGRARRQFGFAA